MGFASRTGQPLTAQSLGNLPRNPYPVSFSSQYSIEVNSISRTITAIYGIDPE